MGTVNFALSDLGRSNSRYFFCSKCPKSCYEIKVYLNYYPSPLFISAWIFYRKYRLDFQVFKSNWNRDKRFSQLSKYCFVYSLIYGFWWSSCYSIFSFMCMFCRYLGALLYFFFWAILLSILYRFTDSDYHLVSSSSSCGFWLTLGIFKLTFLPLLEGVRVMVFNATFNNISAIWWQSVLLAEDNGIPGEKHY